MTRAGGITIGYLTGQYPRGTDTFIQREVAAIRATGTEVVTFSIRRPDHPDELDESQRVELDRTISVLPVSAGRVALAHLASAVRAPGAYLRTAALAVATAAPGAAGLARQLAYFAESAVLARHLRRAGVRHLHNHFADSSCTVAMLASSLSGIPFSFTLHGPKVFFAADTWRIDAKLRAASFCSCISWFARSQAAVLAPDRIDACHVVHCGVDPSIVRPSTAEPGGQRLLFVGRLAEEKGLNVLVAAVAELAADRPGLALDVVGDGPERERVSDEIRRRGLDDVVTLHGHRTPARVADLVAATNVFVLPSFAEGVPVSLMEAMAAGVPVVATAVGGVGELVEHGRSGLVTRPGDVAALRDAIAVLLDDPALRAAMGAEGAAKVRAEFDSRIEARRLLALVMDSVDGRPSATRPEPV